MDLGSARSVPMAVGRGATRLLSGRVADLGTDRGLRQFGWIRVGLGGAGLARPAALSRALGQDSATAARGSYAVRMAAGRDLALGVGLLAAVRHRGAVRPWLLAMVLADTVDAVALVAAAQTGQVARGRGVGSAGLAVVGAGAGIGALRALRAADRSVT